MKNQNDLIVSIVSLVIGLIFAIVFYATEPQVVKPADPTAVDTAPPKLPAGDVVFANSLPGASSAAPGGGMGMGVPASMGGGSGATSTRPPGRTGPRLNLGGGGGGPAGG